MTSRDEPMAPGAPNPGAPSNDRTVAGDGGDLAGFDRAIHELHGRIADLRGSVDDLGGPAQPRAPAGAPPAPPPAPPPAEPAPAYGATPYEAGPYAPPEASTYAPPAPPPDPYATQPDPYAPPPEPAGYPVREPYPPDGGYPAPGYAQEGSDAAGTFSRVDVGPFEDLLAMTAFEEQLSALPSMADVRVRRFGHGRAEIELETVGLVPVAREMLRIAPDAQASIAEDGTLSVQLYDERWTGGAGSEEPAEEGESPPPESGEERDDARG